MLPFLCLHFNARKGGYQVCFRHMVLLCTSIVLPIPFSMKLNALAWLWTLTLMFSYRQDDNRYSATRGAHLNLKRAEKARVLVNKIPGMF